MYIKWAQAQPGIRLGRGTPETQWSSGRKIKKCGVIVEFSYILTELLRNCSILPTFLLYLVSKITNTYLLTLLSCLLTYSAIQQRRFTYLQSYSELVNMLCIFLIYLPMQHCTYFLYYTLLLPVSLKLCRNALNKNAKDKLKQANRKSLHKTHFNRIHTVGLLQFNQQ